MTRPPFPYPRLTIAIPTLNRARLLARSIESALAQTADEIEIIVSDNGSTDSTTFVLEAYEDRRLRKIRHARTMPAAEHGNFLVGQARGQYFVGLSDDDYLEPEFSARVLELLERQRNLSFVYTGCIIHYADVQVPALVGPKAELGTEFLRAFFSGEREVCWCACVTPVSRLRQLGPIPADRIFGDLYYWTRLSLDGDVGCIADPLSHYTFMTDNLSSATPVLPWAREVRLIADEVIAALAERSIGSHDLDGFRRACDRFVARSTANQFVWNAIRGRSRRELLMTLCVCAPYLRRDLSAWPRVVGSLASPPSLLSAMVLAAAERRAKVRQST